jgi:Cellulase (glycosyl hydrolase family 5)
MLSRPRRLIAGRLARLTAPGSQLDDQPIAALPRTPALVLALALAALAVGCGVQTRPATNVTSTAATLNAVVHCDSGAQGTAWWELRKAGGSWHLAGGQNNVTCPSSQSEIRISKHVTGLQAGTAYDYRVALDPPPDDGGVFRSPMTRFSTPNRAKPVVAGSTLRAGSPAGPRLELRGVNVWGLQDYITTSFGAQQYQQRATVASTIKSWGANLVRFRVLADDYNKAPSAATGGLTRAQIIQRIKDWRNEVVARGMYFMLCSWDALDGAHSDADWAGNGQRVHQLFADIHAALGDDPMVIYEITNEPNNVSWADWDANMRGSIRFFRETIGYRGLLVVDPIWWANSGTGGQGYDDGAYSGLEAYDAARPGMGSHQLAFAKHDYASSYRGKAWDGAAWVAAQGGAQTKHLIFETEFGNYNGDPSTVSDAWSAAAARFFADRFAAQPNYVGAAAFLFGGWWDANALTAGNNVSATTWGSSARAFLAR